MTHLAQRSLGIACLALGSAVALAQTASESGSAKKPAGVKKVTSVHAGSGERAFKANCSRCHQAPESLSPRITGTVVRHMRVRANLSAEDERLILGFLNP